MTKEDKVKDAIEIIQRAFPDAKVIYDHNPGHPIRSSISVVDESFDNLITAFDILHWHSLYPRQECPVAVDEIPFTDLCKMYPDANDMVEKHLKGINNLPFIMCYGAEEFENRKKQKPKLTQEEKEAIQIQKRKNLPILLHRIIQKYPYAKIGMVLYSDSDNYFNLLFVGDDDYYITHKELETMEALVGTFATRYYVSFDIIRNEDLQDELQDRYNFSGCNVIWIHPVNVDENFSIIQCPCCEGSGVEKLAYSRRR